MLNILAEFGALPPDDVLATAPLRQEIRRFLREELQSGGYKWAPEGWERFDPEFSKKLGAHGWIGMTWPSKYGGQERSSLERYVVTEELLAAGAPIRAHWLADRQFGPLVLAVGTDEQKDYFLPRIAAGTCSVCLGLSEPDSGSDLASIRTKADKVSGGWSIIGTKVWTSYAHKAEYMNVIARTSPMSVENRHAGLTQFIIRTPEAEGLTVRPIINLAGEHDFNEVTLENVFVPDNMVLGPVGSAWSQVTGELAHERSNPDRWLNSFNLLSTMVDELGQKPDRRDAEKMGRLIAHLWTLHRMSFSIAVQFDKNRMPIIEAALLKDLGTQFDQEVPAQARELFPASLRSRRDNSALEEVLKRMQLYSPSFTIRSGTREIMRGITARGLGLR